MTEVVPEHTRCEHCKSNTHYLTITNEVRCHGCDDRYICARCILDNRTYWESRATEAEVELKRLRKKYASWIKRAEAR